MICFISGLLTFVGTFFCSRYHLSLEVLALRQQLGVLKRKNPRPRLRIGDRLFWILLSRRWPAWNNSLIIVKPETVVSWHRAGFRLFWRLRSRSKRPGRPKISGEVQTLIRQMVKENPTWGAPRIHGELLMCVFRTKLAVDSGVKLATDSGLKLATYSGGKLSTFRHTPERMANMSESF